MSFDHVRHHDNSNLASSSSAFSSSARISPSFGTSGTPTNTARDTSAMISQPSPPSSSAPVLNRPRHHVRSYSQEKASSVDGERTENVFNAPSASMSHTTTSPAIVIDPSSPPATSPVLGSNTTSLPMRLKRSPASAQASSSSSVSNAVATNGNSPSPPQSQSSTPPRTNGSPTKRNSSLEDTKEQERLQQLKNQQANRRPKMMRLTPAFSSTPGRIPFGSDHSHSMQKSSSHDSSPTAVRFPAKESENGEEPGAGLQIDLRCIPSPSLNDLNGPLSTSQLDGMIRDRNGRPIKPSLKSPRASVSHFLPGRTSRSDSTPAIPSALHSKSVPSTPTVHKAVHFDSQLEHVKVFKFKQRPAAVSRDGSPEQTETETEEEKDLFPFIWRKHTSSPVSGSHTTSPQTGASYSSGSSAHDAMPSAETEEQLVLRLPNFPSSTRLSVDREIFLERIFLAEDLRSVKGTVQVRNMSFEKWVAIRYTLDHWATIGEVSAEYAETIKGGQADRFTFSIKLNELLNWPRGSAGQVTKSMFMCLRYTVNSSEYWDNNEGLNYQLDFRKRQVPSTPLSTPVATASMAQPRASLAASVSQNAVSRSKVFDLARKGGVGGKGVFAMEDLKRELDKLRSDEEEEIQSITTPRTIASEMKKRASPPSSPGRASSPSASPWTARYDFGQSLRNPRSGSRNTGSGRAAALDYFSAKPMPRGSSPQAEPSRQAAVLPSAMATATAVSFSTSQLNTPLDKRLESVSLAAKNSPDFSHRFGMISPGLGDGPVEHRPSSNADSNVPSANTSPSPTPTPTMRQSPSSGVNSNLSPERFHSFPPSRHGGTITPTHSVSSGRMSPAFFTPSEEFGGSLSASSSFAQDVAAADLVAAVLNKEKAMGEAEGPVITEDFSPPVSPSSGCASPNPFSPSDSVSSVDSDTTVSNVAAPDERSQKAKLGVTTTLPAHARGNEYKMPSAASAPLLDSKSSLSSTLLSATTPVTAHSIVMEANVAQTRDEHGDRVRPASMSDYQELINKYCWNSDLVPSGGSTIPDMPMNGGLNGSKMLGVEGQAAAKKKSPKTHSPALSSGSSTPTLR